MTIKFAQISDLHFSNDYKHSAGEYFEIMNKMDNPFIQLKSLFDNVKKDFDFILLTGDICEYGKISEYQMVKQELSKYLNCPIYSTSGNHENKMNYLKGFLDKNSDQTIFEDYLCENYRVICLDSSNEKYQNGYISEESCELLRQALRKKTGLPTFLITHHHLLDKQFKMPKAIYPEKFEDIIRNSEISGIFNGHTHHLYQGEFAGIPYYTCGSLSFVAELNNEILDFYQHPSAYIFNYDNKDLKFRIVENDSKRYLGSIANSDLYK